MRVDSSKRERGSYIGGHDATRIVGLSMYGAGAADTYAAIVNKTKTETHPRMLRGLLMEPGLAQWVAERRGIDHERDVFLIDDEVPFFGGSIDALEVGGEVMHEFTTTTTMSAHLWGTPGTDDCARHKWIQCQWYMGLDPKIKEAHVWCFIVDGDEEPLHYVVPRNEIAIAELRRQCEEFWYEHILARVPPLPGVHDADADDTMNVLWPRVHQGTIDADADLVAAAEEYAQARAEAKEAEARKKTASARIKAALGDHEGAKWDGGSVSWTGRSIGTKTNWEAIAYEIALVTKIDGRWFNGLVKEHTHEAMSVRALRVNIKKKK